jgi:molybdate transport system substrate-binding protein
MAPTLSSWSCKYEAEGLCRKVDGAYCRPGMKGCILVGKVTFQDGVIPSPVWPSEGEDEAAEPQPDRTASSLRAAAALCALAFLSANAPARAAEPPVRKVVVAASANLRLVFEELAGSFERGNPGVKVVPTFGASGTLFAQIQQGAPFDLFLGADRGFAVRIHEAGLARGEPFHYASGRLVLWVATPAGVDPNVLGVSAVVNPAIKKIAIGNPAIAPYGAAAEQALRSAGFLDAVKGKLVLGESILQVIQFAQSGNVQAAFVPWSAVIVPPLAAQGRYVPVPAGTYSSIDQFGVVLARARDPKLAEEFAAFVRGPAGRTILERHLYALPPG